MLRKKTTEEFVEQATIKHNGIYDYSNVVYKTSGEPVEILCATHGIFTQTPSSHLAGHGCPQCANTYKRTTETFITKAILVHGDTYDYSKVIYHNKSTNVTIICSKHGEFTQEPNRHIRGAGCKKCASESLSIARRATLDDFISSARVTHGDTYDYSLVNYVNAQTKVSIVCKEHGEFMQTPSNHLKYGCKACAIAHNDISRRCAVLLGKPVTLYYIYIHKHNVWKIGCTSRSVYDRFKQDEIVYSILYTKVYKDSILAYKVEKILLAYTKNYIISNINILKGGNTEIRSNPISNIEAVVTAAENEVICTEMH